MTESTSDNAFPESDAFTPYENEAVHEVTSWAEGDTSALSKVLRLAARPLDWAAERSATEDVMEEINERIVGFLDTLLDASAWTYDEEHVRERAREEQDLRAASLEELRTKPMNPLDDLAHTYFFLKWCIPDTKFLSATTFPITFVWSSKSHARPRRRRGPARRGGGHAKAPRPAHGGAGAAHRHGQPCGSRRKR
jgi:hypothetical protein